MNFTINLERMIVNEAVRDIALNSAGFLLPQGMIDDAFCIYTDEAYHTLVFTSPSSRCNELYLK